MTATLFVKHKVRDYRAWKPVYDELGAVRKQNGVTTASIHRDPKDPNTVIVVHQFRDLTEATRFADSKDLKSAMEKAGVSGPPEFWLSEDVEHTQY